MTIPRPENLARDRAGGDARGGLARRSAAAAAMVADAVFFPVGVVGMAGPEAVAQRVVILGPRVLVLDEEQDRRAGGVAFEHAREDLHAVALAALRREARLPRPAPVEPGLDVGFGERQARRHAVDDAADRRSVAFAPAW